MRSGIPYLANFLAPSGSSTREHEMVMIFLNQAPYKCPEHQIDLTEQVREKLQGGDFWSVADPMAQSLRRTLTVLVVRSLRRRRGPGKPFKVLVLCPGTGDPLPHELVVTGTYHS